MTNNELKSKTEEKDKRKPRRTPYGEGGKIHSTSKRHARSISARGRKRKKQMIKDQEGTDLIAGRIGTDRKELRDETSRQGTCIKEIPKSKSSYNVGVYS